MTWEVLQGDALATLQTLEAATVDCVVTSPPYWGLRDYGVEGQLGLEPHPQQWLEHLWAIFDEVWRVMKPTGTGFANLGESYFSGVLGETRNHNRNSTKGGYANAITDDSVRKVKGDNWLRPKQLLMLPARFAIGMQDRGWLLRNDICWWKPNAMPSSVRDRFSCSWEHVFLFVKQGKYAFDLDAVRIVYSGSSEARYAYEFRDSESAQQCSSPSLAAGLIRPNPLGRNPGDHWTIPSYPFPEAHFATFPPELPRRCIRAGCPKDGLVLDPFCGSGTTGLVAIEEGRRFIGIELNEAYVEMARQRIGKARLPLTSAAKGV